SKSPATSWYNHRRDLERVFSHNGEKENQNQSEKQAQLVHWRMASSSSSYTNSPCAACKFLRRKCMPDCIFAPYFPPEEPQKFANVHKIFGASNVSKLLNEVLPHQREDAVNSLAYEAEARMKDPVYGCVGAISVLQRQVIRLQKELDATNADLIRYAASSCNNLEIPIASQSGRTRTNSNMGHGGGSLGQNPGLYFSSPWNRSDSYGGDRNERGGG
ncbi:Lateral organ boundaries domain family protein, partial [Prunus dulcis]